MAVINAAATRNCCRQFTGTSRGKVARVLTVRHHRGLPVLGQSGPAPHLLSGSTCTESLTGPQRSAADRFAQKLNFGPDSGSTAE